MEFEICRKHDDAVIVWVMGKENLCCPLCRALKTVEEQDEKIGKLEDAEVPF